MKHYLAMACFAGALSLSACGGSEAKEGTPTENKTDANEANFRAALAPYIEKNGRLCLGFRKWPIEVSESQIAAKGNPFGLIALQMEALQSVGLVQSSDVEGRKAKSYHLAEAAKPFIKETDLGKNPISGEAIKNTDLCWGQSSLDKIIKWVGPSGNTASVHYTYKLDSIADWAKTPSVLAAFEYVKSTIDGAGKTEKTKTLQLTNLGWEVSSIPDLF